MMDAQNQLGSLYGNMGQLGLGRSGQQAGLSGQQASNDLQREALLQNMWDRTYNRRNNILSGTGQGMQKAGEMIGGMMMSHGGPVPGYAHGGDSYRNDTVPAMLSPGEIVLPRSVTQDEDAPELAKEFVEAIKRHRPKTSKKRTGGK